MKDAVALWEPKVRSLTRIVAGYMILLHGLREVFGFIPARARGADSMMPLDSLGAAGGVLLFVCGVLLIVGWLSRPAALLFALQCLVAYFYASVPWDILPILNGGIDDLTYACFFVYVAIAGAGAWSVDALLQRKHNLAAS
jgi:putative oxidoreductase